MFKILFISVTVYKMKSAGIQHVQINRKQEHTEAGHTIRKQCRIFYWFLTKIYTPRISFFFQLWCKSEVILHLLTQSCLAMFNKKKSPALLYAVGNLRKWMVLEKMSSVEISSYKSQALIKRYQFFLPALAGQKLTGNDSPNDIKGSLLFLQRKICEISVSPEFTDLLFKFDLIHYFQKSLSALSQ